LRGGARRGVFGEFGERALVGREGGQGIPKARDGVEEPPLHGVLAKALKQRTEERGAVGHGDVAAQVEAASTARFEHGEPRLAIGAVEVDVKQERRIVQEFRVAERQVIQELQGLG